MKNYRGRILSLQIVIASSILLLSYLYLFHGIADMAILFVSILYGWAGWSLGKKYDKAKYESEKDALTGVYNRRFAVRMFPKLKRSADRKSEKLMILVIDIDNFKSINDLHDHETGDKVLRQLSGILVDSFRDTDVVSRWGGDEFLIMLHHVDDRTKALMYNNLQDRLSNIRNYKSLEVSVSIGYSVYPDEGHRLDDLIAIADRKMFLEKTTKPNRPAYNKPSSLPRANA